MTTSLGTNGLIRIFAGTLRIAKDLKRLQKDSKDSGQPLDAQADLSLRWEHMQSGKKCCAPAHIIIGLRNAKTCRRA